MKREVIATGKTVDEALEKGYTELGVAREDVQFEILDLPKKGFLGIGGAPARVRVYQEISKAQVAVEYLKNIFEKMGLDQINIELKEEADCAKITLTGEGLGVLIGRRGETLDALQYLSGLVANRLEGGYYRIIVDGGNYREKREKTLETLAKKVSSQVIRSGRNVTLEPMNPYERRVIHATVQNIDGVTSVSVGEEPARRVVISCVNPPKRPYRERSYDGGKRDGGRRGHSRGTGEKHPAKEKYEPQESETKRTKVEIEDNDEPLYSKIEID